MTAQFSDSVNYKNEEFAIAGMRGDGLFSPRNFGLEPQPISTACWRGFVCWYQLQSEILQLQKLWIRIEQPLEDTRKAIGPTLLGVRPKYVESDGCLAYENLNYPVAFSGGLLIGRDFISELYVHMGFHPAWKFCHVHELLFEDGVLLVARDLTSEMEHVRAKVSTRSLQPKNAGKETMQKWVEKCFSLDYQLPF